MPFSVLRIAGLDWQSVAVFGADWNTVENTLATAQTARSSAEKALSQRLDALLATLPESPERSAVYNARRQFFQTRRLSEKAQQLEVVAALPELAAWRAAARAQEAAEKNLEDLYHAALGADFEALRDFASNNDLQRSLLFASHELLHGLGRIQRIPVVEWRKKERQIALSFAQYVFRAAAKTSPFSRLTTLALLRPEADAEAPPFDLDKVAVTPNVALLPLFYEALRREPAFYRTQTLLLNPSLDTSVQQRWTWLYHDGVQEAFQQCPPTPLLEALRAHLGASERRISFSDAAVWLRETTDAEQDSAEQFLFQLIDLGLLEFLWPVNGLSAGWSGSLYNYLGRLEARPRIVESASLLQWMRTAARVLPYQPVEEARTTQQAAGAQLSAFFAQNDVAAPEFPPEQLFYEDVARDVPTPVPAEVLKGFVEQLAACWSERGPCPIARKKADMTAFFDLHFGGQDAVPWLQFCRAFLEAGEPESNFSAPDTPPERFGALLQPFHDGNRWRAVVNGLHAGGGKLSARWLHLFPDSARAVLEHWHEGTSSVAFPDQGMHNASFQPVFVGEYLETPGGRFNGLTTGIPINRLNVRRGAAGIGLVDSASGRELHFYDLGLESPESRPPAMRLLWYAGMPQVSLACLLGAENRWQAQENGLEYRPRIEYADLTLARACRRVKPETYRQWLSDDSVQFFKKIRGVLSSAGLPRHFFAAAGAAKPQWFDADSPLHLLLLQKLLAAAEGDLYLWEMLPLPGQCVAERQGRMYAMEVAVEWRT